MKKKSALRGLLIGANCVLGVAAVALAALLVWNHLRVPPVPTGDVPPTRPAASSPESPQPAAPGSAEPAAPTLQGPRDSVPQELVFSMDNYGITDKKAVYRDGVYYLSRGDQIVSLRADSGKEACVIDLSSLPEHGKEFFETTVFDFVVTEDAVYLLTGKNFTYSFSALLKVPLDGSRPEYLLSMPANGTLAERDGVLYILRGPDLVVLDPASGEPQLHSPTPADTYWDRFAVVEDDVYYRAHNGIYRYNLTERMAYAVAAGYGVYAPAGGHIANGIYYSIGSGVDDTQYLYAYDTATGVSSVIDGRVLDGKKGFRHSYLCYIDGFVYYPANDQGDYKRYNTADGSITDAFSRDPDSFFCDAVGGYIQMGSKLVDPATGDIAITFPERLPPPAGHDYSEIEAAFEKANESYGRGAILMPDGRTFPLNTDE